MPILLVFGSVQDELAGGADGGVVMMKLLDTDLLLLVPGL